MFDQRHHDGPDEERNGNVDGQNDPVERKQLRSNQLYAEGQAAIVLAIPAGHDRRISVVLQDGHLFALGQRPSKMLLLILHLREDIGAQFRYDVLAPGPGKILCDLLQISIEQIHTLASLKIRFNVSSILRHSSSSCLRISLPSLE